MLAGVNKLADAVTVTLGPKGRNVVIDQQFGAPKITKDGVTVAKACEFADRYENLGAQLVRGVASKTNDAAGDGTTTATVLTRAIYAEAVRAVAAGMNPMDVRRGISAAVEVVLERVKRMSRAISSKEEITQVAVISANGDVAVGKLLADAMERVGKEGVITVQESVHHHHSSETSLALFVLLFPVLLCALTASVPAALRSHKKNSENCEGPCLLDRSFTITSFCLALLLFFLLIFRGRTLHDELEVVEGMRFDRGFISPYFITNAKTQRAELDNPLLLFFDGKISNVHAMVPLLEAALQSGRPFAVIAEDVEGEALATLVINKVRGSAKIVAIKAPGFGDNRKESLADMATLCGATLLSDNDSGVGVKLENAGVDVLGSCKKLTVTKDDTIILDGAGDKAKLEERCALIRAGLDLTTSEYEKEKLQERLAKLSGGVAVIRVGGASEVEVGEKKDRVDDALHATRAAIEEGIVPGGGLALLYATQHLSELRPANADQQVGVDIVRRALQVPARSILDNAGLQGDVLLGKLLEESAPLVAKDTAGTFRPTRGINAATGAFVDMIEAGIVDPTKVVRTALTDASGVASLMATTEALVVEHQEKKKGAKNGNSKYDEEEEY
jgi:chaperonin GroL